MGTDFTCPWVRPRPFCNDIQLILVRIWTDEECTAFKSLSKFIPTVQLIQ